MTDELHLPVDIYSPQQLNGLLAELQTYRSQVRDAAVRAKAAKHKTAETVDTSEELANLLRTSKVELADSTGLEALNKQLEQVLKSAPVMHLTFSAPANRMLKRQITVWFRSQVHPHSLLTFAARGDIGGGLLLQAGSHFYDFSFRDRLLANKKLLTEIAGV